MMDVESSIETLVRIYNKVQCHTRKQRTAQSHRHWKLETIKMCSKIMRVLREKLSSCWASYSMWDMVNARKFQRQRKTVVVHLPHSLNPGCKNRLRERTSQLMIVGCTLRQ